MLFFLCEMYIFITYTTDNTLYYFFTSLVLRLMPLAYAFHIPTTQDIKMWVWVKEKNRACRQNVGSSKNHIIDVIFEYFQRKIKSSSKVETLDFKPFLPHRSSEMIFT